MKLLRLIAVAMILAAPLSAQDEAGASLTIGFANATSSFHIGEIIPIELSFRASSSDTYEIEMRNYDRSGRLGIEQFHVTPPGRDPLQRYYSVGVFIGGGLGGPRELSGEPQIIRQDLNEWIALDRPGHYSLYVTSRRISRHDGPKDEPVELRSNSLEFEVVVADPAWQQQTLASALATLRLESSTLQEKSSARRTLRFLDSPASVRELVHLMGTHSDGDTWNEIAGLAGSRYQSMVVHELEEQMLAPEIALTSQYLYTLAKLKFQLDHEAPPPYPEKDRQQQKSWSEQRQTEDKELIELQDALSEKAASLVASKWGTARAETVSAILRRPTREPGDPKPISSLSPEEIASAFLNLSENAQANLLSSFAERLKIPAMVAPLKKVAEQPRMQNQLLRDIALRCLYDLDPSEARPIFLQEIRHPHVDGSNFTVKAETLGLLPNETLPEFDELLSSRLEQKESRTKGLDAQLIGRYSTKAILSRLKATYETSAGQWDCLIEDGLVLYFLRVDPDYGVKRLAVAPSSCMRNSLPVAVGMGRWGEVEPGILARLDGPDLDRAQQAAETLARYGSPQAEKALWKRLSKFHSQWEERADDLEYRAGMPYDADEAISFQYRLIEAIGKAQAWLLSDEEISALENLALGRERNDVKEWHWKSPVSISVNFFRDRMQASINQYMPTDLQSLRAKLAQYPSGTRFLLSASGSADKVTAALAAIDEVAAFRGLQIERHSE